MNGQIHKQDSFNVSWDTEAVFFATNRDSQIAQHFRQILWLAHFYQWFIKASTCTNIRVWWM